MNGNLRFPVTELLSSHPPATTTSKLGFRFCFRASIAETSTDKILREALATRGCQIIRDHQCNSWPTLIEDAAISSSVDDAQSQSSLFSEVYSFRSGTLCNPFAFERCSGVEWLLCSSDVTANSDKVQGLASSLAYDVQAMKDLQHRVQLLRNSVEAYVPIGIGMTIASLLANIDVVGQLPVDFVTAIDPTSVLSMTHPARPWLQENLGEQVSKMIRAKKAVGRPDLAIVLQAPIRSGYDVAGYLANGIDAVVLNGFDWRSESESSSQQGSSLAASFLGTSSQSSLLGSLEKERLEEQVAGFFRQFHDAEQYFSR